MTFELKLIGGFTLSLSKQGGVQLPTRKSEALLAVLALAPGMHIARGKAADLLWSDRGEEQARASLRQEIAMLRKKCSGAINADRSNIWLDANLMRIDVIDLRKLAKGGKQEQAQAAEMCTAPLLPSCDIGSEGFAEWLSREQRVFSVEALDLLSEAANDALETGDNAEAGSIASRMLDFDPMSERAYRLIMTALERDGDRSAALARYAELETLLKQELDVEPSDETKALRTRILSPKAEPTTTQDASTRIVFSDPFEGRPALAVLPLRALSKNEGAAYFADSMTEDIVAGLAAWRWFPVIGTTTTRKLREH